MRCRAYLARRAVVRCGSHSNRDDRTGEPAAEVMVSWMEDVDSRRSEGAQLRESIRADFAQIRADFAELMWENADSPAR